MSKFHFNGLKELEDIVMQSVKKKNIKIYKISSKTKPHPGS